MSLTRQEVVKVVNRYIGVSSGYLGDFSYRTHAEFYTEYCDLDIDPSTYEGATRERFIEILSTRSPLDQAKILRGVIDRFGDDADNNPNRSQLRPEMEVWIARLEGAPAVDLDTPKQTRHVVVRALADADELIRTNGATSAVDRIHTALHGHVLALCESTGIEVDHETTTNRALKLLRQNHPALAASGPRAGDITRILGAMATVLDSLNPIRNNASVAHPNAQLLDEPEAHLAINAARTVFAFLDAKLSGTATGPEATN
jgi:Abortive infection C-terminus